MVGVFVLKLGEYQIKGDKMANESGSQIYYYFPVETHLDTISIRGSVPPIGTHVFFRDMGIKKSRFQGMRRWKVVEVNQSIMIYQDTLDYNEHYEVILEEDPFTEEDLANQLLTFRQKYDILVKNESDVLSYEFFSPREFFTDLELAEKEYQKEKEEIAELHRLRKKYPNI